MAEDGRSVRTIIGYTYDKQSEAVVSAGIKNVSTQLQSVTTASNQFGAASSPAIEKLQGSFASLKPRIASVRAEITDMRQVLAGYGSNIDDVDKTTVSWIGDLQKLRGEIAGVKAASAGGLGDAAGAGGGNFNLSRIGSAIRSLPSTPLPGTGLTSDAVGNLLRVAGAVQQLGSNAGELKTQIIGAAEAIGIGKIGAVASIAGLAVVIKILQNNADAARAAAQKDLDARAAALKLIVEGDQAAIQSRLNVLATEKQVREAQAADASQLLQNYRDQVAKQFGIVGSTIGEIDAVLGTNNGELSALKANADAASKALNQTSSEMAVLTAFTGKTAQTTEQAAQAEERLALARGYGSRQQEAAADALQLLTLATTGTEKQVRELIASKEREIQVNELYKKITDDDLAYLDKRSAAYQSGKAASDQFQASIDRDRELLKGLTGATLDAAIANDRAAASEKIRADSITATQRYNDALTKNDTDKNNAIIKASDTLLDKITDISQKAVDGSTKILEGLQQKQADLERNLNRTLQTDTERRLFDQLQSRIKFQSNEVAEEKKTQQEIERIRQQGKDAEFTDALDRNFAALAQQRRSTAQAVASALQQASVDKTARLERYAAQNADDDAQFAFQRKQKIDNERLALQDAQEAARQQLQAAEDTRKKQLNQAQRAYNDELTQINNKYSILRSTLNAQITAELRQIAAGDAAKLQLEAEYYRQSQALIKGIYGPSPKILPATGTGSNVTPRAVATRAGGGSLSIGQSSFVNEPWSSGIESFKNSHGSMNFPDFGIFTPLGSGGTVNSNNRGISLYMTNHFQGTNPDQIIPQIRKVAMDVTADAIERMNRR